MDDLLQPTEYNHRCGKGKRVEGEAVDLGNRRRLQAAGNSAQGAQMDEEKIAQESLGVHSVAAFGQGLWDLPVPTSMARTKGLSLQRECVPSVIFR